MIGVIPAIAPIFILIVIGHIFKRTGFPGDGLWWPAERLTYYVLLPALIVHTLAGADLDGIQIGRIGATVLALAGAMTAICLILRPVMSVDGPAFSSIIQGTVRLNSYVGFAVAAAFFGPAGLTVTAVFVAFMMPTVNVIAIAALARYGAGGKPGWWRVPVQIATNPLIVACLVGIVINLAGLPQPGWILGVLVILGKAALPVALLCVGAGLDLSLGKSRRGAIFTTCTLKLVVMPFVAWGVLQATGLTGLGFAITMMMAATPASPGAYVMARQLGGDAPLMAGIVTAETALSAITLSAVLAWLGSMPLA
jgi:malonate transporter and related proteins